MLFSMSTALLTLSACFTLASAACNRPFVNFALVANTTGKYAALGDNCGGDACDIFFSVSDTQSATRYNLTGPHGLLEIGNLVAYTIGTGAGNKIPDFCRRKFIGNGARKALACAVEDSPSGDGSCDLVCSVRAHGGFVVKQSTLDTTNSDWWLLGYEDNQGVVPVTIKVVI